MRALGRARASMDTDGFVKIPDVATDEVLGVHMVGARAADLIAEAVTAMEFERRRIFRERRIRIRLCRGSKRSSIAAQIMALAHITQNRFMRLERHKNWASVGPILRQSSLQKMSTRN